MNEALFTIGAVLLLLLVWGVFEITGGRFRRARRAMVGAQLGLVVGTAAVSGWLWYSGGDAITMVGLLSTGGVTDDLVRTGWARLSLGLSGLAVVMSVLAAFCGGEDAEPQRSLSLIDKAVVAFIAVTGSAIVACVIAMPLVWFNSLPLQVASATPLVSLALILWLVSSSPAVVEFKVSPKKRSSQGPEGKVDDYPDPLQLVVDKQLILPRPVIVWPGQVSGQSDDRVWGAAGGLGLAPTGIEGALGRLDGGGSVLVPDLPGDTEDIFLVTLLLRWGVERSRRSLVVHPRPKEFVDRFTRALARLGAFRPGPICQNGTEVVQCLRERRLPSLVVVDTTELSDACIPEFGKDVGRRFVNSSPLMVLCRPDRLQPVEATHLALSCTRLGLLADAASPSRFLVTAPGTNPMLHRILPVISVELTPMPAGLLATDRVRLHRGVVHGSGADAVSAAVRQTHTALMKAGVNVRVEDPAGLLSHDMLTVNGVPKKLDAPGTLGGRVCLITCCEAEISVLFRAASQRARRPEGEQLLVWWTPHSPVANYMLEEGRLVELHKKNLLPAPLPLFGSSNRFLEELHLRLALQEGMPTEKELESRFTPEGLRRVLAARLARLGRSRATYTEDDRGRRSVERSHLVLPAPALDEDRLEARTTVTSAQVEVIDQTGSPVDVVDRQTAHTHYYPTRVFSRNGRRYEVPIGPTSDGIEVRLVDWSKATTMPKLRFSFKSGYGSGQDEPAKRYGRAFQLRVTDYHVRLTEFVSGSIEGRRNPVSFDPVKAEYNTRIRVAHFAHLAGARDFENGLTHMARLLDDVLITQLRAADELIEAVGLPDGCGDDRTPAVAFIDRHIGGMGAVESLSLDVVHELLQWTKVIMQSCKCMDGCELCTPLEALHLKAKQKAIQILET